MRAVNLIPSEQRRGPSGPGQSGAGVYVLLGGLAAALIAVGAYVVSSNSIASNKDELARVTQQANQAEVQAAALKPYRDFASLSQQRSQTVSQLASSRFDWETAIRQVSRVLPTDAWLTSFVGTVAPGINVQSGGAAGSGGGLRALEPVPAFELVGCTTSQSEVSRIMARLRRVSGVTRVSLSQSQKADQAAAGQPSAASGGSNGGGDCRYSNPHFPLFDVVAFFGSQPGAKTPASPAAGAATPVSTPSAPVSPQPGTQNTSQTTSTTGATK